MKNLQGTLRNQAGDVPLVLEAQSIEARLSDDALGSRDHISPVLRCLHTPPCEDSLKTSLHRMASILP